VEHVDMLEKHVINGYKVLMRKALGKKGQLEGRVREERITSDMALRKT
jgi:hypothetical protein